jgi:hypothetical protein
VRIKVRKADIPPAERDLFERYGERVISGILTGGFTPAATELIPLYQRDDVKAHARDWLTERDRLRECRENLMLWLEVGVLVFVIVGVAIDAGLWYGESHPRAVQTSKPH